MMEFLFRYIAELTLIYFLGVGIFCAAKRKSASLDVVLPPALPSATIPTGLALTLCAFSPDYIDKLADIQFYIGVVGIALILIAINSIKEAEGI